MCSPASFRPPFIFSWAFSFLSGYLMVHCGRMCILGVTRTRCMQVMHMQHGCQNEKLKKNQAQCICDPDSFTHPLLQCRGCTDFLCWWGNLTWARGSQRQPRQPLRAACCVGCAWQPFYIAFSREPYVFFRKDEFRCPNSNSLLFSNFDN